MVGGSSRSTSLARRGAEEDSIRRRCATGNKDAGINSNPHQQKRFGEGSGQAAEELRKARAASIQGKRHVAACLFCEHQPHLLESFVTDAGGRENCDTLKVLS